MAEVRTIQLKTEKADKLDKAKIEAIIGRPLANPINSRKEGEEFNVTLTGDVQFTQFGEKKSAHLLTKEGYRVSVPANFDKGIHKTGASFSCVCMIAEVLDKQGKERKVKYTAFAI